MPTTIRTCSFKAESWSPPSYGTTSEPLEILQSADPDEAKKCEEIFQCSTSKTESPEPIVVTPNGLIHAVVEAWNRHYHLVLRPDDFWFAIVSQLSFYITANAEALRSHFVAHEGKKKLVVRQDGNMASVDYGLFANLMTDEIRKNVKDPGLQDWVLPNFTTTTPEDRTVAAVLFMGAMQKYFEYFFDCITCGIPEITILGERDDWVKIQNRLDKLLLWGDEAKEYHKYLTPIFKNIVASFDDPASEAVVTFWKTMVSHHGPSGDSGGKPYPYITGWITGLFLWNNDGKVRDDAQGSKWKLEMDSVILDGVYYQRLHLDSELIPAVTSVPVTVRQFDPFGNLEAIVSTRMMARLCGFKPCEKPDIPSVSVPNSQPSALKVKSKSMGWDLWLRLGSRLRNGRTNKVDGDAEETDSSRRVGNTSGGSKEGSADDKKSSVGDTPGEHHTPKLSELPKSGSNQNTVKPVAFWWIYKVPEGG